MDYSIFVHYYLIKVFHEKTRAGELSTGKAKITISGKEYDYIGEVDQKSMATGWGVASKDGVEVYEGYFVNGISEGILINKGKSTTRISEMKRGKPFGKSTIFGAPMMTMNYIVDAKGNQIMKQDFENDVDAFYSYEGRVVTAFRIIKEEEIKALELTAARNNLLAQTRQRLMRPGHNRLLPRLQFQGN